MSAVDDFRLWLLDQGLTEGTADVYSGDAKRALAAGGFPTRLRDESLAPKTRRHILAAGRQWAEFHDDAPLAKSLKRFRLPPARRKTAKVPLERIQLFDLIDAIGDATWLPPHMRSVLGIMATRGFRVGDVLRIQRTELTAARESGILSFEAKGRRRLEFKLLKTFRVHVDNLSAAPGSWERIDELVAPNASAKGRRKAAARAVERALVKVGAGVGIWSLYPHRLRRTYAVQYLLSLHGDAEAVIKLTQHMQWASHATAMEYIDHARGDALDEAAEKIFDRGDE